MVKQQLEGKLRLGMVTNLHWLEVHVAMRVQYNCTAVPTFDACVFELSWEIQLILLCGPGNRGGTNFTCVKPPTTTPDPEPFRTFLTMMTAQDGFKVYVRKKSHLEVKRV